MEGEGVLVVGGVGEAVGEGEGGRVALAVTVAASAVVVRRRRRRRRTTRGRKSGGFGGSEVRERERDIVERE
jgi:hypothetical protein